MTEHQPTIEIREGTVQDKNALLEISQITVSSWRGKGYTDETIDGYLEMIAKWVETIWTSEPTTLYRKMFVAVVDGQVVGFSSFRSFLNESRETAEVSGMHILPKYHGRGIGSMLAKAVEQVARERKFATLHVDCPPWVVGFYEKCGFVLIGKITWVSEDKRVSTNSRCLVKYLQ